MIWVVTIVKDDPIGLRKTLESIASQSQAPRSIIVSGGGHEAHREVCSDFQHLIEIAVFEDDHGIADAFNKGTSLASKEGHVCYLNAGDCFASPSVLRQVAAQISTFGPDIIYYGDYYVIDEERDGSCALIHAPAVLTLEDFAGRNPLNHQSVFIPVRLAASYPYDARLLLGMDYDLWLRLLKAGHKFAHMAVPVARFARGGRSSSPVWQTHQVAIRFALYEINMKRRIRVTSILRMATIALRKSLLSAARVMFNRQ